MNRLSAQENFFLWCSFPDPHHPFAATKPYSEMYDPAEVTLPENWREHVQNQSGLFPGFPTKAHGIQLDEFDEAGLREMIAQTYGMITHVDDNIGRVIQALKESGRYDNTVIAFMSDHGDYLGAHHLVCKGAFPFEEIMRIPFIWSSPQTREGAEGRVEPGLSSLLDVAPTMLDYAGVPLQALQPKPHLTDHPVEPWFDGQSLRSHIDGAASIPADRHLITNKYENKLLQPFGIEEPLTVRTFYKGRHKLVITTLPGNNALFDLETDPREMRNLWDDPAHRDLREQLLHEYTRQALRTDPIGVGRVSGP
jgi:arylsulfatase A-like enzyme